MTMLKKLSFDHNTSPKKMRSVDDFNIKCIMMKVLKESDGKNFCEPLATCTTTSEQVRSIIENFSHLLRLSKALGQSKEVLVDFAQVRNISQHKPL